MNHMKIALLGTVVAVGIAISGGSAFAADLRMPMHSEPAPVMSMPAPAGNYVSVFAGAAFPMTATGVYHNISSTSASAFGIPTNTGYVIGGTLGTHLTSNLRGEIELSYVSHGSTGKVSTSAGTSSATGSFNTLYLLGNLWYDFDTGNSFTPYVGGGLGLAVVMPNLNIDPTGKNAPYTYNTDSTALAGQLGAGIKYQIADSISLDLGYRAKYVRNVSLAGTGNQGNLTAVSYLDQTVQAGLTFGF
jgi:opacity protein-like surface antigen